MDFDPALDRPYTGPMPSSDFGESQQWNFFDGTYGIMYHIGSMPGDHKLWHNAFAIACPDGSSLATKIIGRGPLDGFGAHTVNTKTIEPYKAWRISFDGALRRFDPAYLQLHPGTDGRHITVRVELDVVATHEVWDPGARAEALGGDKGVFQTMAKMHHEQALATTGFMEIDGKHIEFSAAGHRDHSFGPRDFAKLKRGFWVNGTFDSGWAFLAFEGELVDVPNMKRGGLFENGQIVECQIDHEAELTVSAPEPRIFTMRMTVEDGRRRDIQVKVAGGVNWTADGPTEWCLGTNLDNPRNYVFTHYFAELQCGEEKGVGFVDRGALAALLIK